MIRQKRLSTNWRFPITKVEMKVIYAISLSEETINEIKFRRLPDVSNYQCPFVKTHQMPTPLAALQHIPKCWSNSVHGLKGKEAQVISQNWMICPHNSGHMFVKPFESVHYLLQERCKPLV